MPSFNFPTFVLVLLLSHFYLRRRPQKLAGGEGWREGTSWQMRLLKLWVQLYDFYKSRRLWHISKVRRPLLERDSNPSTNVRRPFPPIFHIEPALLWLFMPETQRKEGTMNLDINIFAPLVVGGEGGRSTRKCEKCWQGRLLRDTSCHTRAYVVIPTSWKGVDAYYWSFAYASLW